MNGVEVQTSLTCLFFFFSTPLASYAVDTIFPNQLVSNANQFIDSSGGTFRMGFFSPGNSQNHFLGIWYRTIPDQTTVWVANRDSPLNSTSSGFLQLSNEGNLQIISNNTILWSSGLNLTVRNPVAQLLESGNLVIRDVSDENPENYYWQSFDHPTHTALPGMKIGRNFITGVDRILRSWSNRNDPSTGNWSFFLESTGFPSVVLFYGGTKRFSSGPWNGERFSGSTGLRPNPVYTYEFVLNQEETYYSFHLINSSVFSILVLNPEGILQRLTWNYRTQTWTTVVNVPADNCDTYSICHGYGTCDLNRAPICSCLDRFRPRDSTGWAATDWSNGCERRTALDCGTDGFVRYSGLKLPDTAHSWYDQSMSIRECERMCLRNCSCMAYSNTNITGRGSGCLLWFDDLVDIKNLRESGQDIFIRMARSELGSSGKRVLILEVCLSSVAAILLLGLIFILYRRKKKKQKRKEMEHWNQGITREGSFGNPIRPLNTVESKSEDLDLPVYDLSTLLKATNYFSPQNKIGEGGFGSVYKGTLEKGQEIAVKRLSKNSIQGTDEFKNEVILIEKLQHRNLVKLLGCCIEEEEKMLVYELMPNKSLDYFLFDKNQSKLLDWPTRFRIINGIARGLLYLHQDSRLRIIHRDLKAANILLDNEMNPKISDFGMARIFGGQETEANTRRIVGTYGYMSPEYAVDGNFSVKSDVFGFGVLVLEIISGHKNRGFLHSDHHHNLIGHAWILHNEGRSLEFVDANLNGSCHIYEILRTIHVGLLCVQKNPEDRPSMSNVVLMLGSEGGLSKPKEPGFFTERNLFNEAAAAAAAADSSSSKHGGGGASSVNEYDSITIMDGR